MTQEEKDLLLKDLCARAQYRVNILVPKGVRIHDNGRVKESDLIDTVYGVIFYNDEPKIVTPHNFSFLDRNGIRNFGGWTVEEVRPYLRPMSSMTEEERKELSIILGCEFYVDDDFALRPEDDRHGISLELCDAYIDWLNANYFDYRIVPSTGKSMIESGIALEAPEGMYKIE